MYIMLYGSMTIKMFSQRMDEQHQLNVPGGKSSVNLGWGMNKRRMKLSYLAEKKRFDDKNGKVGG